MPRKAKKSGKLKTEDPQSDIQKISLDGLRHTRANQRRQEPFTPPHIGSHQGVIERNDRSKGSQVHQTYQTPCPQHGIVNIPVIVNFYLRLSGVSNWCDPPTPAGLQEVKKCA